MKSTSEPLSSEDEVSLPDMSEDTDEFPPQVEMWYREELAATPDDTELVRRWFQSLKPDKRGCLLIVVVDEVFQVGSTAAGEICRRHGYEKDMCRLYVRRPS
jgi:hypothetical protein